MSFPELNDYLARLATSSHTGGSVWRDSQGQAQGRFFNCTITSAFQPLRELGSGRVRAYAGLARSVAASDAGLSLWRLLDHAASDDESIALDRLCRMLHSINFFRQAGAVDADLFLNVHDRLLSAVSSNHGYAFRRILDALGLPRAQVVLQLPAVTENQGWLLGYVADNYRRNGFRLALQAGSAEQALHLLGQLRPAAIELDARRASSDPSLEALITGVAQAGVALVFKRLDDSAVLASLQHAFDAAGAPDGVALLQGRLFDMPQARLVEAAAMAPVQRVETVG
jgi:EAL domain-containing protein (putative c-di-GMP-specific phosphodiesterase class I)